MSREHKPCRCRGCRRTVGSSEKSDKCSRHRRLMFKANHAHAYSWGNLKRHAKARGIKFTLTVEDYKELTKSLDLTKLVSHTTVSISVDRTENSLGYHRWNVSLMSLRQNSRKQYVIFFNGGMTPKQTPDEIRQLDRQYRNQCENLADEVAVKFEKGTQNFWLEFRRRKIEMFEFVTA